MMKLLACSLLLGSASAAPHMHDVPVATGDPAPPCTDWPQTCPDGKSGIPRSPYKQTWMMNLSTIIMPCNNTGYTDPESTKGWGIVDCACCAPAPGPLRLLPPPLLVSRVLLCCRLTCLRRRAVDWSNGKGTGTADGWAKHKPMDDEEMLFKQVQMTTAATKGTTVWVYRNTVSNSELCRRLAVPSDLPD
jgi:hypothetical protein